MGFVRSRPPPVTGDAYPLPGCYSMVAPAMHLEQHERGNHVVQLAQRGAFRVTT
jgi:hypothetical protein